MNLYGAKAKNHMAQYRPQEYQLIEDKEAFFTEIGEEAQRQVSSTYSKISRPELGERDLASKMMAEELVHELIYPSPSERDRGADGPELGDGVQYPGPAGSLGGARFRPSGQHDLAPAGALAKTQANLAALRTLRQLQSENRAATASRAGHPGPLGQLGGGPRGLRRGQPALRSHSGRTARLALREGVGSRSADHHQCPLHLGRGSPGRLVRCHGSGLCRWPSARTRMWFGQLHRFRPPGLCDHRRRA